jgi:hypothetical protein
MTDDQRLKDGENYSLVSPTDETEEALEGQMDLERAYVENAIIPEAPEKCDMCGTAFKGRKYWIDAKLKGGLMWGNMCSACFPHHGEAIGWGFGQLYARTHDDVWLMVAGFAPGGEGDDA